MKASFIASGFVVASLVQGLVHAQVFDLPEPGGPSTTAAESSFAADFELASSQYAGSLRLGTMSRKEEGTQYRVLLEPAARLQRLDLRVAFGKARLREAWLVTESGHRIEVEKYRATGVLETSSLYNSENFSLNENISEVQFAAEAFSDDAELILTAVSENVLPKLTSVQVPVKTTPVAPSFDMPSTSLRKGNCVDGFCVGDVVIYMRNRGKLVEIRSGGRVVVLQRGVNKVVRTSQLIRPSLPPYRY